MRGVRVLSDHSGMVVASTAKGLAMCWMCDHPGRAITDFLNYVYAKALKNGWAVQYVESDSRLRAA